MNGFIARESCTLNGTKYLVGDFIPHSEVVPARVQDLIDTGVISPAGTMAVIQDPPLKAVLNVIIPILAEEGRLELEIPAEEIGTVIEIMQLKADDAILKIKELECQDALIMVHALDDRKTVQAAAKARADELVVPSEENGTEPPADGQGESENEQPPQEGEMTPPTDDGQPAVEEPNQEGGEA